MLRNHTISNLNSVVAVFESYDQTKDAIRDLRTSGFDMEKLSSVGMEYEMERRHGWLLPLGAGYWAGTRGGTAHQLDHRRLEEAGMAGGLTSLGAGLYSVGIPKKAVVQFETEVKNGKHILVAHGTPEEVELATDILRQTQARTTTVHAERVAAGV